MSKTEFRFSTICVAGFAIMGLLFAFVDLLNYAQLRERFTPFSVADEVSNLTYDEAQVYVPGARRFYEKNDLKTEVDVFELRQNMGAWPIAHSVVIGSIAKLVGSLETSWVIAHAVFPASVWLICFVFARKLGLPIAPALTIGTGTCLVPFGLRNFFLIGQDALIQPLELSRMPHPGLSFALLLLGALAVSHAVATGSIIAAIGAGVLIGLNFYSYYFYWIVMGLGLGTWLGAAAILRRTSDIKLLCVVGLTASVIGLPFLVTVAIARSQGLTNLMERLGTFNRESSLTDLALALTITSAVVFVYARNWVPPLAIALSFALAGGALGLNLHLITGYNAKDYYHFMKMFIQPLAFFVFGIVILRWLPRPCYRAWVCIPVVLVLFTLAAYRQVRVARNVVGGHDRTEGPVQLVETLRNRLPAGSVVGSTDPQVLALLPALSTLWTFVPLVTAHKHRTMRFSVAFLFCENWKGHLFQMSMQTLICTLRSGWIVACTMCYSRGASRNWTPESTSFGLNWIWRMVYRSDG